MKQIVKAAEQMRRSQKATDPARAELRLLLKREIAAGTVTKAAVARELGISRQRVQQILSD